MRKKKQQTYEECVREKNPNATEEEIIEAVKAFKAACKKIYDALMESDD